MNCFVDLRRRAAVVCFGVAALGALAGAQTPEEFARRRIESGRAFLRAQNYAER